MTRQIQKLSVFLLAITLALSSSTSPSTLAEKIKVEEIVARHLESIGSAKARAAGRTRILSGTSQVAFRTPPPGQAVCKAVLASTGIKNLLRMSFPRPVYPREQLWSNGPVF